MYCEYFGLKEPPFRITPDTRLFFAGGSRGAILNAMVYAVARGEGIIKVVGEVGTGKTMLCRMLEVCLPSHVEVVYLANPSLCPADIPHAIATEMGFPVHPNANRLQVLRALQERLVAKHAAGRQVVIFIEEAQCMPLQTLEEVRLLSNLETQQHKLLQMVLFGQPELEQKLAATEIRQLRERITQSFELPAFGAAEIREYVDFRMRAVGYRGPAVFSPAAIRQIGRASRGLTRRVNILADKALLAAYASGTHRITSRHVHAAVKDSEFSKNRRRRWGLGFAAGLSVAALAVGAFLVQGATDLAPSRPEPSRVEESSGQADDAVALFSVEAFQGRDTPAQAQKRGTVSGRDPYVGETAHESGTLKGSP